MGAYRFRALAPRTVCKDGTSLSVQASGTHHCLPRDHDGPYTHVEVGYLQGPDGKERTAPRSWSEYGAGDGVSSSVFCYVPVELVERFIKRHGGRTR
jgi:hypothetical protein